MFIYFKLMYFLNKKEVKRKIKMKIKNEKMRMRM